MMGREKSHYEVNRGWWLHPISYIILYNFFMAHILHVDLLNDAKNYAVNYNRFAGEKLHNFISISIWIWLIPWHCKTFKKFIFINSIWNNVWFIGSIKWYGIFVFCCCSFHKQINFHFHDREIFLFENAKKLTKMK